MELGMAPMEALSTVLVWVSDEMVRAKMDRGPASGEK
jgi:hypothetical protein